MYINERYDRNLENIHGMDQRKTTPVSTRLQVSQQRQDRAYQEVKGLLEQRAHRQQFLESLADRSRPLPDIPVEQLLRLATNQWMSELAREWGLL